MEASLFSYFLLTSFPCFTPHISPFPHSSASLHSIYWREAEISPRRISREVDTGKMGKEAASSSLLRGARYFVIAAALHKLVTFALNQAVIRVATPDVLGFAHHDLEIILGTLLSIVRDTFRSTALRSDRRVWSTKAGAEYQSLVNVSWLSLGIGSLTSTLVAVFAVLRFTDAEDSMYKLAVLTTCVGVVLEFLAEPLFIQSQNRLEFGVRAGSDIAAALVRSLLIFSLVMFMDLGAVAYGIGQMGWGAVLLCYFLISAWRHEYLPPRPKLIDPARHQLLLQSHKSNLGVFGYKSLLQFAFTQGDRVIVSLTSSMEEKGIYGIVTNYGKPHLAFSALGSFMHAHKRLLRVTSSTHALPSARRGQ